MKSGGAGVLAALLAAGAIGVAAQTGVPLTRTGKVMVAGQAQEFVVRHLPVNAFPALPARMAAELNRRGCTIPQTYEAHRPENVIRASLERPGSEDWAALCSVDGTVTLLVFFASSAEPMALATAEETERLEAHDPGGVLGFNWGIDPATPERVREAQSGMTPRPARLDHDALADSVVEHKTVYHFYTQGVWTRVATAE